MKLSYSTSNVRRCGSPPVLLIYPPLESKCYTEIYPSLSVLAAALDSAGYKSVQLDLNNMLLHWYLTSGPLKCAVREAIRKIDEFEAVTRLNKKDYEQYVEAKKLIILNKLLEENRWHRNNFLAESIFPLTIDRLYSEDSAMFRVRSKVGRFVEQFLGEKKPFSGIKKPLFVGISVAMPKQIMPGIGLVKFIKKTLWRDVKIILGGASMTLLSDESLHRVLKESGADGIVLAEGEGAIVDIAEGQASGCFKPDAVQNFVWLDNGKFKKSTGKASDLFQRNTPPLYDKKMLKEWKPYALTVVLGRRCYWGRCAYCNFQNLYKIRQMKEPVSLVEDVSRLIERHGMRNFKLCCDTVEPDHVRVMCREILRRRLRVNWYCFVRVDDRYTEEDFFLMQKAGCQCLTVGLESLDDGVLKRMDKGYTEKTAVSFLKKMLATKISARINMIYDLPGTNYESARRQYSILRRLFTNAAGKTGADYEIRAFKLTIYKASPLGKRPSKYGIKILDANPREYVRQLTGLAYANPNGMKEEEKASLREGYKELNRELVMIRLSKGARGVPIRGCDQLIYPEQNIRFTNFDFEIEPRGNHHRKLKSREAVYYNFEMDDLNVVYDPNFIGRIKKLLPMKYCELEKSAGRGVLGQRFDKAEFKRVLEEMLQYGFVQRL